MPHPRPCSREQRGICRSAEEMAPEQAATLVRHIKVVGWQPGEKLGCAVVCGRHDVEDPGFFQHYSPALVVRCAGAHTAEYRYPRIAPPVVELPVGWVAGSSLNCFACWFRLRVLGFRHLVVSGCFPVV